jgi:hypothetical protein
MNAKNCFKLIQVSMFLVLGLMGTATAQRYFEPSIGDTLVYSDRVDDSDCNDLKFFNSGNDFKTEFNESTLVNVKTLNVSL